MLVRAHRLRASAEIKALYQQGRSVNQPLFRVVYAPAKQSFSRATVIVSKRVSVKAVIRNRIKRQLRVQLKKTLSQFVPPLDLAIIAKVSCVKATSQAIARAWQLTVQNICGYKQFYKRSR
ncbi:MAG: ribonuclease P protein component [Patescibacteria group bacterium]|jgi:ribonuclease P protein component